MRNRYKKICFKCGKNCPANEGFLLKVGETYHVHHAIECNPVFDLAKFKRDIKLNKFPTKEVKKKLKTTLEQTKGDIKVESINKANVQGEYVDLEDDILPLLESTLAKRKTMGQPIVMLPTIINYIKGLQARIEELSK